LKQYFRLYLTLVLCVFFRAACAMTSPWEVTLGYGNGNLVGFDHSNGVLEWQGALGYFPDNWTYGDFQLGGQFSTARLEGNAVTGPNNLTIGAISPVIRWSFLTTPTVQPFLEAGVGVGAFSGTQFDGRSFGSVFTFRDFFGVGLRTNTRYPMVFGVDILHYSNASLAAPNPGITMPVLGYMGVCF